MINQYKNTLKIHEYGSYTSEILLYFSFITRFSSSFFVSINNPLDGDYVLYIYIYIVIIVIIII